MSVFLKTLVIAFLLPGSLALAKDLPTPYNHHILEVVKEMPIGGGYDTSGATFKRLKSSVAIEDNHFVFAMEKTTPSFCSSATYLVFLKLITKLQQEKKLSLDSAILPSLMITAQPDGSGVWGRWNANGPGTARFFYELSLGANFTELAKARPGDFMKAFWTDEIGVKERGHSVIFTGVKDDKICFWSSNSASATQPAGMGEKCLAKSKFRRLLFSRLQSLENLNQLPRKIAVDTSTYSDQYLSDMLKRASSADEMCSQVACHTF